MKALFSAMAFLTVIPVPQKWCLEPEKLGRSVVFFPFVGLLIGGLLVPVTGGLFRILPALPAGVLLVILTEGASGGLHLDGLADTADGFLSARPRERALEIMRDSASGVMGVAAVISVFVLKVSCIAELGPDRVWRAVLIMPLVGRVGLVLLMTLLPYARNQGGLGDAFYGRGHGFALIVATVVAVAAGWGTLRSPGLFALGTSVLTVLFLALVCRRRIGGATGDTLGAGCEIGEAAFLLALLAQ